MPESAPQPVVQSYRQVALAALPASIAVGTFAVSIGIVARAGGLGWTAPTVFSAATYAGASQVAAIGVITGGGGIAAAIVAGILVNLRYIPVGISVASCFHGSRLRRFVECQIVADVNWALAHQGGGRYDRRILLGAGVMMWAVWVIGTIIGLALGGVVGDPRRFGLDALFPAMFVALLLPQLRSRRSTLTAALAAGVALLAIPFVPPGIPILLGSLAVIVGGRRGA